MKASFRILAVLCVAAMCWWACWSYDKAQKREETKVAEKIFQSPPPRDQLPTLEEKAQNWPGSTAEQRGKIEEFFAESRRAKQKLARVKVGDSIEFVPQEERRDTWTGHTDPDRVWHKQRQQARETLIKFDVLQPSVPPSLAPRR